MIVPLYRGTLLLWLVGALASLATAQVKHTDQWPPRASEKLYITIVGGLRFTPIALTGHVLTLRGAEAPLLQLSYPLDDGFHVSLQVSDFRSRRGHTIAAKQLQFHARHGEINSLNAPRSGPESSQRELPLILDDPAGAKSTIAGENRLPRETGARGTLNHPLVILSGAPPIQGEFSYHLDPEEFQLRIPANTHKGHYEASLTVTLAAGP
jgi:hypothetical protein